TLIEGKPRFRFYSQSEINLLTAAGSERGSDHIAIQNALEKEYSHLKRTNIFHLAALAEQNLKRGLPSIKVYEFGKLFTAKKRAGSLYDFERDTLTLAAAGRWHDNEWRKGDDR